MFSHSSLISSKACRSPAVEEAPGCDINPIYAVTADADLASTDTHSSQIVSHFGHTACELGFSFHTRPQFLQVTRRLFWQWRRRLPSLRTAHVRTAFFSKTSLLVLARLTDLGGESCKCEHDARTVLRTVLFFSNSNFYCIYTPWNKNETFLKPNRTGIRKRIMFQFRMYLIHLFNG